MGSSRISPAKMKAKLFFILYFIGNAKCHAPHSFDVPPNTILDCEDGGEGCSLVISSNIFVTPWMSASCNENRIKMIVPLTGVDLNSYFLRTIMSDWSLGENFYTDWSEMAIRYNNSENAVIFKFIL